MLIASAGTALAVLGLTLQDEDHIVFCRKMLGVKGCTGTRLRHRLRDLDLDASRRRRRRSFRRVRLERLRRLLRRTAPVVQSATCRKRSETTLVGAINNKEIHKFPEFSKLFQFKPRSL